MFVLVGDFDNGFDRVVRVVGIGNEGRINVLFLYVLQQYLLHRTVVSASV